MKLAAADADCKRCLDEVEAARDVTTMHRRVSRAFAGCRTRPLTLGFGNARLEGAAGPPRGAGDALAGLGAGATAQKGAAQQCPMLSWKCTSNIF